MISSQDILPDYVYRLQGGTSQNLFTFQVCLFVNIASFRATDKARKSVITH